MRKRKARRRAAGTCASILVESKPNARWVKFHGRSVLMHDCFSDRRRALIAALLDILAGTMTKSR